MKIKKLFVLLLVLGMASLVLTGCFSSDEEKIKATIEKHYEAMKQEDILMVGKTLDASFEMDNQNKDDYLASLLASFILVDYDEINYSFDTVTITGDTAVAVCPTSVTITIFGEAQSTTNVEEFTMVKTGGDWLIKSIAEIE